MSVGLIATLVIGALVALGFGASALLRSEGASPAALLARMADIIASSRASLPGWISAPPDEGARAVTVELDTPADGVAPGQAAVFYDGEAVLGGGWIDAVDPLAPGKP